LGACASLVSLLGLTRDRKQDLGLLSAEARVTANATIARAANLDAQLTRAGKPQQNQASKQAHVESTRANSARKFLRPPRRRSE
jgi:hypothetical protein